MDSTTRPPRTPEDIHAGMLGHPQRLGAPGCICDILARDEAEAAAPDAHPCYVCGDPVKPWENNAGCIRHRAAAPDAGLREALGDYANPEVRQAAREKINDSVNVSQWFAGQLLNVIDRAALAAHRSSEPSPAPPKVKRTPSGFRFLEDGAAPTYDGFPLKVDDINRAIDKSGAAPAGPAVPDCPIDEYGFCEHGRYDGKHPEAAGPAVDVDRLARALAILRTHDAIENVWWEAEIYPKQRITHFGFADRLAAEYDRLAHPDPTGEPEA